MRPSHLSIIAILLAGTASAAEGDVLQVPPAAPEALAAPAAVEMAMPVRGMTTTQVEQKFGAPQEKIPAVGEPPISRWEYADYTVYFEHQYVIHSVPRRK